jgi:hypothetical protein
MSSRAERYVELALRLARHEPELVDSYHGPAEIAGRVSAEAPRPVDALVAEADELLADATPDRWLIAQVLALRTTAGKLAGESPAYADEVESTYGVRPRWFDERQFRDAHAALDEALPGGGSIRDRYFRWLDETRLPPELVEPATRAIAAEVRERTRRSIGLPEGEDVELEFVTGERPRGYAHYLGGLRTLVSINAGRALAAADIAHLVAHETYPGHHAHRAWQVTDLVEARGEIERALDVVWSPEAVMFEGIAEAGAELVLPDGQQLTASVLARLGFAYDAEVGTRVAAAVRGLAPVNSNAMLLLQGPDAGDARAYALEWSLQPEDRVARTVERLAARRSPGYVHSYSHGLELVRGHVRGDLRRLRELMTSRAVPADL